MSKYLFYLLFTFTVTVQLPGQALQHKPKQLFLSPAISIGIPTIINPSNYGYSQPGLDFTFGGQLGIMIGWDYYLKQSFKTGIQLSKWGQHFSGVFTIEGTESNTYVLSKKKVNNYYLQIPLSYKQVFGRKRGYDHEVFSPYVFGSVTIGYLFYSNVSFFREQEDGSLQEQSLVDFVTEGNGWNNNEEEIIELGNPEKDKELFSPFDINLDAGGGFQFFVTRMTSIFAEAHLTTGILDINAGKWRLRNNRNVYKSSHNLYVGINLGANLYLYRN